MLDPNGSAEGRATALEAVSVEELGRRVDRWVEAGVIGREQGDAILALEGAHGEPAGGRRAVAVEVLGYLAGGLYLLERRVLQQLALFVAVGMVVFLGQLAGQHWRDLGGPLAILLVAAAVALARLRPAANDGPQPPGLSR